MLGDVEFWRKAKKEIAYCIWYISVSKISKIIYIAHIYIMVFPNRDPV